MKTIPRDYDERMQIVRDTWIENETARNIRRNGKYPIDDDDCGMNEPSVLPQIWIDEGISQ